jgi:outer membrane protein, heavy metal efflux system
MRTTIAKAGGGAWTPAVTVALTLALAPVPSSVAGAQSGDRTVPVEHPSAVLHGDDGEAPADPQSLAPEGELTLSEVYRLAGLRSPRLSAARFLAGAVRSMEASAALPPDPFLEIGAMSLSLPGLSADMPTSMVPSIRAMQMVPFPGKLSLRGRIAERTTAIHEARSEEVWWAIRTRAAMAFYEIYTVDRELAVMRETLGLLEDFERVARAMYSAGTGRQADVLRAGVEIARMEAEIRRMEAMAAVSRATLNALLDRPADTSVPSALYPPLPATTQSLDTLRAWADQSRPVIQEGRLEVERARTRRELARRELWPDLSVGIQYGQRPSDGMGTERMGSLMLGFSVPVFAGSRQLRMRDEAQAMERMAVAELTEAQAGLDGRLAGLLAELAKSRTLISLYRSEVLPQARANVEAAFASYRVGSVDFMTLVEAQMSVNRYEADLYRLLAEYGVAVAGLEMTLGRELPLSADLILEER